MEELGLACRDGDGDACMTLARASQDDPRLAVSFTQAACKAGSTVGCEALAGCFEEGRGVGRDLVIAAGLYGKACAAGSMSACTRMARLYEDGRGVGQDPVRAAALYAHACEGGDQEACREGGQ